MQDQENIERTIAEYVQEYSVNRYTLNKAIRQKGKDSRLPARRSGGVYLIRQSDFDVWYANHRRLPRKTNSTGSQKSVEIDPKTT